MSNKVITVGDVTYTFNSGRTYGATLRVDEFNALRPTIELLRVNNSYAGLFNIAAQLFAVTTDVEGDALISPFWRENRHKAASDVWAAVLDLEDTDGRLLAWWDAYMSVNKPVESADFLADKPTPDA